MSTREIDTHACPFCGWHKTQIIGPAGITSALMHCRCSNCEREWDEAVDSSGEDDDSIEPTHEAAS